MEAALEAFWLGVAAELSVPGAGALVEAGLGDELVLSGCTVPTLALVGPLLLLLVDVPALEFTVS